MKSTLRRAARNPRLIGLLIVLCLDLVVIGFVGRQIVGSAHRPFDSDEAYHTMRGLKLAQDLSQGKVRAFLVDAYQQSLYPPGQAALQAVIFILFGASTVSARLCSLGSLVVATLAIYGIGLELEPRKGHVIGLVAVGLTLTSQYLLVLSGLVMLEVTGLAVTMVTLLLYLRSVRPDSGWRPRVMTSLLLSATLLVKYPFGLMVLATVSISELAWVCSEWPLAGKKRVAVKRWLALFAPFVLFAVIWFVGEDKVSDFIYYATLQPEQTDWRSWYNLSFYPISIALHYLPSPYLAPMVVVALLWTMTQLRRRELGVILVYLVVGLSILVVKEVNNPRFLGTIAPAIYLVCGAFVAALLEKGLAGGHGRLLGLSFVGVSLLASVPTGVERLSVWPELMATMYETDSRARELAAWILEWTHRENTLLINPWDQFSRPALEWHAATHRAAKATDPPDYTVTEVFLSPPSQERVKHLDSEIERRGAEYVVVLEGGFEGRPVWADYESALSTDLVPLASTRRRMDLYMIGGWMKREEITHGSLAAARERFHVPMTVEATVYRRWDSALDEERPQWDGHIDIGSSDDAPHLGPGWYFSEDIGGVQGRWSGKEVTATLRAPLASQDHVLRLRALAYPSDQRVTLIANGRERATFSLSGTWSVYSVTIPAEVIRDGEPVQFDLVHREASSPYAVTDGASADKRTLAAGYDWLALEPLR